LSDLTDELGAGASAALADDFISLLADPDTGVRTSAAAALVRLGSVAVAALQATLNDPAMRVQGMEILTAIGPASRPATDAIIQALSDSDPLFQGDAAMAIAAIGPQAGAAVPALQKILASSGGDPGPRYSCVYALGSIGAAADSAVEKLIELTRSDDKMLATVAVWAALKIRPADRSLVETAVPLLRQALRGEQELVRLEAAVALGDIGSAARTAIPILELIAEEDPVKSVRAAATEALAKVRTP
jgi:HEAT repeat protein